jgi:UDP-N-acetylglucosamine 2-epimerase (non-hydrolysing)
MPEEINRMLTDQVSDLLFTPSIDANSNLRREGIDEKKVHFVGNVMIDTLIRLLPKAERSTVVEDLGLDPGSFALVTLHRPSNVDEASTLSEIVRALLSIAASRIVVFPVHPRTRERMEQLGLSGNHQSLRVIEPLSYIDFLALQRAAFFVITDSGGVQEETTYLGVPCLTVRPNTERPVTIEAGTNRLVGNTCDEIVRAARGIRSGDPVPRSIPDLWDGHAGERIAEILHQTFA